MADSIAHSDGRIAFFTETSAFTIPEVSIVHGQDSMAWSPMDFMFTRSAGYSPIRFQLAILTDSAHGGGAKYDYSLLASDTAARSVPCGTGSFGATWNAADTLVVPINSLRLSVTWDAWANNSLIEFGIPKDGFSRDSVFLQDRNTYPVLYDTLNPMRRVASDIWSEKRVQPVSVAIGLGNERFRIQISDE